MYVVEWFHANPLNETGYRFRVAVDSLDGLSYLSSGFLESSPMVYAWHIIGEDVSAPIAPWIPLCKKLYSWNDPVFYELYFSNKNTPAAASSKMAMIE